MPRPFTVVDSYWGRVFDAYDQFLNVVALFGKVGQSISDHAADAMAAKKPWGCVFCRFLSWGVETDHCEKQLAGIPITRTGAYKAAGWFTGVTVIALVALHLGLAEITRLI